jgi:hypothetical protein
MANQGIHPPFTFRREISVDGQGQRGIVLRQVADWGGILAADHDLILNTPGFVSLVEYAERCDPVRTYLASQTQGLDLSNRGAIQSTLFGLLVQPFLISRA